MIGFRQHNGAAGVLLMRRSGILPALLAIFMACTQGVIPTPEEALKEFYEADDVMEEQLMDPLILAGQTVVPLVLKEIRNRDMRRRGYAILALGHIGDRRALNGLRKIARDATENDVSRLCALRAIVLIDRTEGMTLAKEYTDEDIANVGWIHRQLETATPLARRTGRRP